MGVIRTDAVTYPDRQGIERCYAEDLTLSLSWPSADHTHEFADRAFLMSVDDGLGQP